MASVLSHAVAAVIASAAAWLHRWRGGLSKNARNAAWAYLFLATASHGALDAMTNGGLGIAFFSPFTNARYFLPWRPIAVSPIGLEAFFSERGLQILATEVAWIWAPAGVLALTLALTRRTVPTDDHSSEGKLSASMDRSAGRAGIAVSAILVTALCGGLTAVYVWAGPRAIQENRYATYAPHQNARGAGTRSNVTIDQEASFAHALPLRPSVELLRRSGFDVYSKKDFGLAIEWQKGIAFFWYSPP